MPGIAQNGMAHHVIDGNVQVHPGARFIGRMCIALVPGTVLFGMGMYVKHGNVQA